MRKSILAFLGLFIFIMIIIPQNVFADTSGEYSINKYKTVMMNIEDDSDTYLSQEYNPNWITNSSNSFYNYYQASFASVVQIVQNNTSKYYTPSAVRFYNTNGITPCSNQCDLTLTFQYGFSALVNTSSTNDYNLATTLLGVSNTTTTDVGGVTIHGIDIDDNEKVFKCNVIFTINNIGQNNPFYKYIASCPTSNYKRIDYIEFQTGWQSVPNTNYINVYNSIAKVSYNIGTYTGTQDGDGSFIPQPEPDDVYDAMTDDNIDSSFQNSTMNDISSQLATNSVISDLLLLPVRMYQSILNSLGSNSCHPFQLGSLYGTNLTLPCIQVQNYIGSALWSTIDLIFCGIFVLVIRKKFVDIFNNMTNLKNGGNELE